MAQPDNLLSFFELWLRNLMREEIRAAMTSNGAKEGNRLISAKEAANFGI